MVIALLLKVIRTVDFYCLVIIICSHFLKLLNVFDSKTRVTLSLYIYRERESEIDKLERRRHILALLREHDVNCYLKCHGNNISQNVLVAYNFDFEILVCLNATCPCT